MGRSGAPVGSPGRLRNPYPRRPHPLIVECRRRRIERGISLLDLAIAVGVSVTTLQEWETGQVWPNLWTFVKLLDFFELELTTISKAGEL